MDFAASTVSQLNRELLGGDAAELHRTLDLVAQGLLTPAAATARLTSADQTRVTQHRSPPATGISLARLLDQLGTPPPDVVDRWHVSLRAIAVAHETHAAAPLPMLQIDDLSVNNRGDLVWQDLDGHAGASTACSTESEIMVGRTLGLISGEHHNVHPVKPNAVRSLVDVTDTHNRPKVVFKGSQRSRLIAIGLIATVACIASVAIYVHDLGSSKTTPDEAVSIAAAPAAVPTARNPPLTDARATMTEFADTLADASPALPDHGAIMLQDLAPTPAAPLADELSFDSIATLLSGPSETSLAVPAPDADDVPTVSEGPLATPTATVADLQATDDDTSEPPESSQATTVSERSVDDPEVKARTPRSAAAVMLPFDENDRRLTWDLQLPPPRGAQLGLELDLPSGIELGWVQPIDPKSLRRATGIAVISDQENEFVSLAYRLDIRCNRKLSVRIRSAARLDASMPWQWVTSSVVDQWLDQLTQRAVLLDRQAAFTASLYDRAGTNDRRDLRPRRDAINVAIEQTRELSERTVSLQTMMDRIAAEGRINLKLEIESAGTAQTIFETIEQPE